MMEHCICLLLVFASGAAQITLTPTEVTACLGDEVVLTCQIDEGIALTWEVDVADPSISGIRGTYLQPQQSAVGQTDLLPCEAAMGTMCSSDYQFVATLTGIAPLMSTLTTTANTALDGAMVNCASSTFCSSAAICQTVTLQLLSPPPPPMGLDSTVTSGTTLSNVTVLWSPSTGADSYTVSVTPDLPSLGGPVTTTGTSLELQDVPYNTPYTVSIVATSSACTSSAAAETVINIAGCVVPERPVNGDWQAFSPSTTVGPGTSLSLSCSPGYVPSEVMSSTCQSDGSWDPDTADLNCSAVDCGPPTLAANVTVEPSLPNNTTFGSTFSFRCAEGFFPNGTEQAVCGADGQWRPDPANRTCRNESVDCGAPQPPASGSITPHSSTLEGAVIFFQCDQGFSPPEERPATCVRDEDTGSAVWEPNPAEHTCSRNDTGTITTTTATGGTMGGSNVELSTGSAVAITAVLCSVVFLLIGAVCGGVVVYCLSSTAKRRAQYSVSSSSTEPQTPAPVYEDIITVDIKPKAIELSENIAYGPPRRC